MSTAAAVAASVWSREEDKALENAIAVHWISDESEEQWLKVAQMVPGKTIDELKKHYGLLVEDLNAIESGSVPIPNYVGEEVPSSSKDLLGVLGVSDSDKGSNSGYGSSFLGVGDDSGGHRGKGSRSEQERRKGIPWTEEEHRLFLLGLDKYGKGDWRSISRNYVLSRTPTQVASHAQKYFIRLNSMNRERRRTSIHDITSINNGGDISSQAAAPITGQQANTNSSNTAVAAMGQAVKNQSQQHMAGLGMYGAPMGHPVVAPGHMASAVGTPVMLPPGHHPHPHPPYLLPVAYPVAPQTMHH